MSQDPHLLEAYRLLEPDRSRCNLDYNKVNIDELYEVWDLTLRHSEFGRILQPPLTVQMFERAKEEDAGMAARGVSLTFFHDLDSDIVDCTNGRPIDDEPGL